MVELSLGVFFRSFNASKVILCACLLVFLTLFTLKLDGKVGFSYAFVFAPLWACNLLVFIGGLIGMCSYCSNPPSRNEIMMRVDFGAMCITVVEHILLAVFETFAFVKLEYEDISEPGYPFPWTIVFCPLFSLSAASIGIAVWALRHDKPFEFEFFYAMNIVQFVFIAFKLDKQVDWTWAVVFIPLWVVLSLAAVGVLYALVLSVVLIRSRHFIPAHRRQHVYSAILHTFFVIPALVCLVLLTGKLDSMSWSDKSSVSELSYTLAMAPLQVSFFFMAIMSAGFGGPSSTPQTNIWWFGLRKPLCPFLLDKCPSLRTYANVSYRIGGRNRAENEQENGEERQAIAGDNEDRDEADVAIVNERRNRQRAEEKTRGSGGSQASSQGSQSGQEGMNPMEQIASSSAAISRAMAQYKNEYGYHWHGDISQPD
ncbi:Protein CBG00334 [Caenorhabditis briggsae]|uniref:Uncharacterized protein n=2 Tax=Caenorhabditis briggsae TaxID=6238 RepID=A0AAE9JEL6_CAEBR|nr:Protein CBG00334 [Caenorhabditis briggsae]ULT93081.1 hypothetical protein L3Y34_002929 [Caenorhabditis briggsae]UMM26338.1 hypothetical protein L5515_010083 [Caenorhabditis briggsae]CAP21803.2 Protein CBG00334 [Caenorhabditis briggsae]